MTNTISTGRRGGRLRMAGWSLAAMILLAPAVAMRFTDEVAWDWKDFLFAAGMIGGVGFLLELAARATPNTSYRLGAAIGVMAALTLVWANAAVGIIGNEENPLNLMFPTLLIVPALAAVVARFRPAGMARAMTAAAVAQAGVGLAALVLGHFILVMTAMWMALWLGAAALFRKAARESAGG